MWLCLWTRGYKLHWPGQTRRGAVFLHCGPVMPVDRRYETLARGPNLAGSECNYICQCNTDYHSWPTSIKWAAHVMLRLQFPVSAGILVDYSLSISNVLLIALSRYCKVWAWVVAHSLKDSSINQLIQSCYFIFTRIFSLCKKSYCRNTIFGILFIFFYLQLLYSVVLTQNLFGSM